MDRLSEKIRRLEGLLLPNMSQKENTEVRAEIALLKEERKKLEVIATEVNLGISFYGSYFMTSQ
jgi:hypothetical protein